MLENLKLGAYLRKDKAEIEKDLKWVYELFPRLEERNWQSGGHPLRRRAADAGGGPGPDVPAEADDAG